MKKQEKIKIHNLTNADLAFNLEDSKQQGQIFKIPSESMELKPWNQKKFARLTARINYKKISNDIITDTIRSQSKELDRKSKRATQTNIMIRQKQLKPSTAPNHSSFQINKKKHVMTQQMNRLKPVTGQDFQIEYFKEKDNMSYYPRFRCSINQRNKLLYLKPYIKSTTRYRKQLNPCTYEGMQKLKSFLYKSIRNSEENAQKQRQRQAKICQSMETQPPNTNRSVYQFLTDIKQYADSKQSIKNSTKNIIYNQSSRNRNQNKKGASLSVLKQKLKNKYKQSKYAEKLNKIKNGEGIPITIIH